MDREPEEGKASGDTGRKDEDEVSFMEKGRYRDIDPRIYAILQAPYRTMNLLPPPREPLLLRSPEGHSDDTGEKDESDDAKGDPARPEERGHDREKSTLEESPERTHVRPRYGPRVSSGDLVDRHTKERVTTGTRPRRDPTPKKKGSTGRSAEPQRGPPVGSLHRSDSPLYIPGVSSLNMKKCPKCGSFMNLTASRKCYVCGYVVE